MYRMPTGEQTSDLDTTTYKMPIGEQTSELDSRSLGTIANQSTAIRIDDSAISVRKSWSSDKINRTKADSESSTIEAFIGTYGELYLSEFDPNQFDDWDAVIRDAYIATEEGKPFSIPWNRYMSVQVLEVNPNAVEKVRFFYKGQMWVMTDQEISPVNNGGAKITMKSTDEWETEIGYVPERAEICIFSDRHVIDGASYPGIKIGDGSTHLVNLPFFGDDMQ